MSKLQGISTASLFTEVLESRTPLAEKTTSTITSPRPHDDDARESSFCGVLGDLLPSSSKSTQQDNVGHDVERNEIAKDEQDDTTTDDEQDNLLVVVNPPILQMKDIEVDDQSDTKLLDQSELDNADLSIVNSTKMQQKYAEQMQKFDTKENIPTPSVLENTSIDELTVSFLNNNDTQAKQILNVDTKNIPEETINDLEQTQSALLKVIDNQKKDGFTQKTTIDIPMEKFNTKEDQQLELNTVPDVQKPIELKNSQHTEKNSIILNEQKIVTPKQELVAGMSFDPEHLLDVARLNQTNSEIINDNINNPDAKDLQSEFDNIPFQYEKFSLSRNDQSIELENPRSINATNLVKLNKLQPLQVQNLEGIPSESVNRLTSRVNTTPFTTSEAANKFGYDFSDIYASLNVNAKEWEQGLGHRILWMRNGGIDKVAIHIEPPELGPLGIQLRVFENKANVTFTSHNPDIKEILESATPKLQRMLHEQGLGLGQVQVNISSQQFNNNNGGHSYHASFTGKSNSIKTNALATSMVETSQTQRMYGRPMALVDYYA